MTNQEIDDTIIIINAKIDELALSMRDNDANVPSISTVDNVTSDSLKIVTMTNAITELTALKV